MTRATPFQIGIISDTHGLLRPEAFEALRGSQLILHAGDIGAPQIIPRLREIAPVVAIRGNIDDPRPRNANHPRSASRPSPASYSSLRFDWAAEFPETEVAEASGLHIYMLHNLTDLDLNPKAAGFAAVISGHSHRPEFHWKDGVLYFNPGSAGPRRFSLPISLGRIIVAKGELQPELITLDVSTK